MAAWKSRLDKMPPAQFLADIIAYLESAYPSARVDRNTLESLYPFFVEEWRHGQNAHDTAKATCACDGTNIVPSAATGLYIPKRSVRPPAGAQRGQVFAAEDLRAPAPLHSAQLAWTAAKQQVDALEEEQNRLVGEAQNARTDKERLKIEKRIAKVNTDLNEAVARREAAVLRLTVAERASPWIRAYKEAPADKPASRRGRKPKQEKAAKPTKRRRQGWSPPKDLPTTGMQGNFMVSVQAVPNKDFDPGTPEASVRLPAKEYRVATLGEAKALMRAFIQENALGAGNLTPKSGRVSRDGKPFARISYNGKIWAVDGKWKETGKELDEQGHGECNECKEKRGRKKAAEPSAAEPKPTASMEDLVNQFAEADLADRNGKG